MAGRAVSRSGPAVFTIAPGIPFLDSLAEGILARHGDDPDALGAVTVLLPTRRAARGLVEAFLRRSAGAALVLPRIAPIGDVEDDVLAPGAEDEPAVAAALDLPPAIDETRRRLILARLIRARAEAERAPMGADQAAWLAAELARLLDQVETEELSFDRLGELVEDDGLAEHWQDIVRFLRIVTENWPGALKEEGAVDPATRRVAMIRALAAAWEAAPPAGPVIAAGSTGSIPATADLLAVVAHLPEGRVVLPGLDRDLDDEAWAALDPGHPQYGLARLLERLGLARGEVADWPAGPFQDGRPGLPRSRARLASEAFRPAPATERWRSRPLSEAVLDSALDDVTFVECPGLDEEARVIALALREALLTEEATAALVTPDRTLARRVAAELGRWGIAVDDSAGTPLGRTPPGAFLLLTATMLADACAPVALLAALKHPLAAGGLDPGRFRAEVRRLERAVLRGPRPGAGLGGLRAALAAAGEAGDRDPAAAGDRERVEAFLDRLEGIFATLPPDIERADLATLVRAHGAFAEALAASDRAAGAARLWAGEAGEAAADFLADLLRAAGDFGRVSLGEYPGLLDSLMAGRVVRPRYGRHPRLHIWGPLEARLQHADTVILGGLNEGTWPLDPAPDPWMSRPMRAAFGLPAPERRIGLSAHDFAQLFAAPKVMLTRALRVEGTPTEPSRWLLRLDAVLRAHGRAGGLVPDRQWVAWQAALDRADRFAPCGRPAPAPPVDLRPRRLSVTRIGVWRRDPYALYAREILRLRPLDAIDADPGAADRGNVIHKALEEFVRACPDALAGDALEALLRFGREAFGDRLAHPSVSAFWWPRFKRVAKWFVAEERKRRPRLRASAVEAKGEIVLESPAGAFRLIGTADRIDLLADGGIEIIDYKTGTPPRWTDVRRGLEPQLPLEALMVEQGGFRDSLGPGRPGPVVRLAYWRLSGARPAGEITDTEKDIADLVAGAREGLERMLARYYGDRPAPYWSRPHAGLVYRPGDYDHLARVREWAAGGGEEGA